MNFTCFCWFPAAILVHQNAAPIWRLHTNLYKGAWNVSTNNSETVGHKDLRLGQIVYILVFYNISFSWLLPLDGFQFIFSLRDSENDLHQTALVSARKDIVSTSLQIIISSWCLIPHWYTGGERCKRMFVKMTCLHETCWLIIISTSCWRNSFNFSLNKAENFHLTDKFRKRISLSKSLPLYSSFQFQFRTGIRNTFVDQIQVNLILGHTANCWFSLDVTKIQTTKLSILPRFYFHDVSEQLKTNFHTSFRSKRVLGFAIEYAWISKLLRDTAFKWLWRTFADKNNWKWNEI